MVGFKIYGDFGMERCTNNKNLLIKIFKHGIFYKIKRFASFWLKFWHDIHFDRNIYWKSWISKFIKFWLITKKNFNFPPIFPIFGQKFPNRDLLIFVHTWDLLAFKIYICGTSWQNFMFVGSVQYLWSFWDRIFAKNHDFLVKTLKN